MPKIHCELVAFSHRRTTPQEVPVSLLQLMTSAATVGMPTLASHPGSRRPLTEMLWRIGMVTANVRPTKSRDRWTRTGAYNRLDPSEKTAVSYFLGMTQAALMSRHVLGYPHLVHVDLLLRQQGAALSGKRPDFVAVNPNRTSSTAYSAVIEAKGRTNRFDQRALDSAKEQVRLTPGVHGLVPGERVASEAFFDDADNWSSVLQDPDGQGYELDFGLETFLLVYYRNIIDAGRESGTWRKTNGSYQFSIPGYPIDLGLPASLVDAYDTSARIQESEARDQAAPIMSTYHELVNKSVAEEPGDLVVSSLRPDAKESELLAVFETVNAEPSV